jgi:hypothetical protein
MDPIIYSFRLKIYPSLCMSSHTHKPNMNEKVHVSLRIQKKLSIKLVLESIQARTLVRLPLFVCFHMVEQMMVKY